MATLDDLFKKYLSRIEPTPEAVTRAAEAHGPLRDDLKKDTIYGPFLDNSMLSGSYGRNTSIFSIKDVDVILQTLFTVEELTNRCWKNETVQACLLRLTREAIERTGRVASTRTARRSIHVHLPEETSEEGTTMPELTMDIVPVLVPIERSIDPLTIADRELEEWFDTYPNSQLQDSIERNHNSAWIVDRHSYKPLVKIFRAWKKVHFKTKTPTGFVLECMTTHYFNPEASHWAEAVRDLWQNICDSLPHPDNLTDIPEVHDISNAAPRLIKIAKTVDEATRVLRKIHQHLALVKQAIEEAKTDLVKSSNTLRRVFGQDDDEICFPLPEDLDDGGGSNNSKEIKSSPYVSKSDVREAPQFG